MQTTKSWSKMLLVGMSAMVLALSLVFTGCDDPTGGHNGTGNNTGTGTGDSNGTDNNTSTVYEVGDTGSAGGLIFYDKSVVSNGWRYLEAAPSSIELPAPWGAYIKNVSGTGNAIGTGKKNTQLILAYLETISETGKAVHICDGRPYGGYTDWFLPSQGELNLMYINLKQNNLGNFQNDWYWSSTEAGSTHAWGQDFGNGNQSGSVPYGAKDKSYLVRVIRQF
ncbi:hypothetical protein FACS1894172_05080 [Spirochaetia bacterium]|nr:hypothetical protein FACS1894164_05860 [Spirochaetia bacterium]GHU30971.1 hypothetical protein FACS1894172_05080 [Spirochaetia bacterium]